MCESRRLLSFIVVLCGVSASLWPPLWAPLSAQEQLRDPTRPNFARPVEPAAARPVFEVTAIFISDRRRVAVVNGQLVAEGGSVDGATVTEVLPGSLRIQHLGREMTVRLMETTVHQQPESEN